MIVQSSLRAGRSRDTTSEQIKWDVWLWAHAWGELGCLGLPTAASNYWHICSKTACHHRIDGHVCRREDLPSGRKFPFDVLRSVPNFPPAWPNSEALVLAYTCQVIYNCMQLSALMSSAMPVVSTLLLTNNPMWVRLSLGENGPRARWLYDSLNRASRQSNAALKPFSCLI